MAADVSSSSSDRGNYDVFLSFRGVDTRKIFVGHLYSALRCKGLPTFKDAEELGKGDVLTSLVKAIEASKLAVVVISENFAFSKWCMIELSKIMECAEEEKLKVLPIFYQVDIADVKYVRSTFKAAFAKHVHDAREKKEELQRWEKALRRVGEVNGWDSRDYKDDAKLIDEVAEKVFGIVMNTRPRKPSDLVGMDSHIRIMKFRLRPLQTGNDVHVVGIWGMGGIGKTTLAKAVYEEMCRDFKHHVYLDDVKKGFKNKTEAEMQEDLLCKIWKVNVRNYSLSTIMEKLCEMKLFLVLDDVDNPSQIDALLGKQGSFGPGSRIIITTRDRSLLTLRGFDVYELGFLNNNQALELFQKCAFRTIKPSREYDPLLQRAVHYAQGLPLALKVLGNSLYSKTKWEWEVELEKIKKRQHLGIEAVLITSFEGLDHFQKMIFLDIACFFRGMRKEYAIEIMDACGFFPVCELPVLVDRALVTDFETGYYSVVLAIHDLLVDMALGIVRRELSLRRLSRTDEIENVLTHKNVDTKAVETLDLDLHHSTVLKINAEALAGMTKLRLLRIHYNRTIDSVDDYYDSKEELYHLRHECKQYVIGDLKSLSHELRCLIWHGCPLISLPSDFHPKNLVDLDMRCSHIERLWEGSQPLEKLKFINLSRSPDLKETPDLSQAPNLEKVDLEGCTSLSVVHPSISELQNLVSLNLKGCKELKVLPRSFRTKSLETLELSGCSKLENFPEIPEVMRKIQRLCLDKTAIKDLPSSIDNLKGLLSLSLRDCREFQRLPSIICRIKSLKYLILSGCSKFEVFPELSGASFMEGLTELHLDQTSIKEFMPASSALQQLLVLSLRDCRELKSLPSTIEMISLETFILSGCSNLEKFPEISQRYCQLTELNLDAIAITELHPSIKYLHRLKSLILKDCGSLQSLPNSIFYIRSLEKLIVSGCSKFKMFPAVEYLPYLDTLRLENCTELKSLPSSICKLKSIRFVSLSGCSKFEVFPEILGDMENFRELHLDGTSIIKLDPSIDRLKRLVLLNMRNCRRLVFLPESVCNLSCLAGLILSGCLNLHNLPQNLDKLEYLVDLEVEGSGVKNPVCLPSSSTNCLVGIDRHISEMKFLLCTDQVDDVRIVGICGIGGIGKTTIATAVFGNIAPQFQNCCYLENVSEGLKKHGAVYMQEKLLSIMLKEKVQSLGILNGVLSMIMKILHTTKVLVVLDDVDDISQVDTLLGKPHSFGGGSRIIITTKEEQVMSGYERYCPKLLDDEALELFRHFAFRTTEPSRAYDHLSQRAIEYAQGMPIALKVLGCSLHNKRKDEWERALEEKRTIYWMLTTSFDGLHESERNILLDLAWFFRGTKIEYATKILQSCGFFPYSALGVLIDRSLVAISDKDGTLKIHDLVHGIVQDCVRQQNEHDAGGRTMIESHQGINCLSSDFVATVAVEVITLDLSKSREVYFNGNAFVAMKKLRLLQIYDNGSSNCKQHVIRDFQFISHELRCLIWHRCPLKSLPSDFHPKNLVDLDMRFSRLELLWEGIKPPLKNLAFINLSHSLYLEKIPDLTEATNLEKLILDGCTSLLEVHTSIWDHKNLVVLSLKGCSGLKFLPKSIYLKSLQTLNLDGCSGLDKFPVISEVMTVLSELNLDDTTIRKLPSSVERLQGLESLSLRNCTSLVSLPESMCSLAHLQQLYLDGCSKLSKFPEKLRNVQSLKISGMEELPFFVENREADSDQISESSSESEDEDDQEIAGVVQGDEYSAPSAVGGVLRKVYNFFQ